MSYEASTHQHTNAQFISSCTSASPCYAQVGAKIWCQLWTLYLLWNHVLIWHNSSIPMNWRKEVKLLSITTLAWTTSLHQREPYPLCLRFAQIFLLKSLMNCVLLCFLLSTKLLVLMEVLGLRLRDLWSLHPSNAYWTSSCTYLKHDNVVTYS